MPIGRNRSEDNITLLPLNPEIERTLRKIRAEHRHTMAAPRENLAEQREVAQPQPIRMRLRDIQMPIVTANPSCIRLSDAARNYELKSMHLNTLPQFNGLTAEDALTFIREFYSTVQTLPL